MKAAMRVPMIFAGRLQNEARDGDAFARAFQAL